MIYSIIRAVVFISILIAVGLGANWLLQSDARVIIDMNGRELPLTIWTVALLAIGVLLAFWLLIEVVRFLLTVLNFFSGNKNAFSRYFRGRSQRKGMDALSNTVNAMASGDSKAALSNAYKADKFLDHPVLTGLLVAQSARSVGKTAEAEAAYKKVLAEDKGRFAAIRGLTQQRLEAGDKVTALQLANKAIALKPNDLETVNNLFELQVDAADFEGARKSLKAKARLEKLPSDFVARRESVLAISEAKLLDPETDAEKYTDRVLLAHRLSPSLVPAAVLAAEAKAKAGNNRAADTILIKAWNAAPHPDIAAAFAKLVQNETPEARLRRFAVLTKRQKNHPETRMLHAELLIAVELFPHARRALGDLETLGETSRSLALMAAIEHGEGADPSVVRAYLARAANASRGSQWVCKDCGHVHKDWHSDCGDCGNFDTLDWKVPPEAATDPVGLGVLMPILAPAKSEPVKDAVVASEVDASKVVVGEIVDHSNHGPIDVTPSTEATKS